MDVQQATRALVEGHTLTRAQAREAMTSLMSGEATSAQIAGLLVAARLRGESVEMITGFSEAMREAAVAVPVEGPCLDTCGTGGDHSGTFNISTATAFVVAGGGVKVAKHGNRGVSSRSGSADVLSALGVRLDMLPHDAGRAVDEVGLGFLFAPRLHPAMRHAMPVRRELGLRTVFNILGPLVNPARAQRQVLGVFDEGLCRPLAEVLRALGSSRAWVVHGLDGLDELGLSGSSKVASLEPDGSVTEFVVHPRDAGLGTCPLEALAGGSPDDNAAIIQGILQGEAGPRRDVVVLNAGAALLVADRVSNLAAGCRLAEQVIDTGRARAVLDRLCAFGESLPPTVNP